MAFAEARRVHLAAVTDARDEALSQNAKLTDKLNEAYGQFNDVNAKLADIRLRNVATTTTHYKLLMKAVETKRVTNALIKTSIDAIHATKTSAHHQMPG